MNFPPEFTKDLYNFPLEKIDKVQVETQSFFFSELTLIDNKKFILKDYINDVTARAAMPENKNVTAENKIIVFLSDS
jgi:hypothetical protein